MIKGHVTGDREAVIQMEVFGLVRGRETVDAVIDTGFNGFMALPGDIIDRLRLQRAGKRRATLADGRTLLLDVFIASVLWHARKRDVLVLRTDGGPLVGMALLFGNRVSLTIVDSGEVTIDPII